MAPPTVKRLFALSGHRKKLFGSFMQTIGQCFCNVGPHRENLNLIPPQKLADDTGIEMVGIMRCSPIMPPCRAFSCPPFGALQNPRIEGDQDRAACYHRPVDAQP